MLLLEFLVHLVNCYYLGIISYPNNGDPDSNMSPEISDNISQMNESFVSADDDGTTDEVLLNDLNC